MALGGRIPADRPVGWYVEKNGVRERRRLHAHRQEEIFGPSYCVIASRTRRTRSGSPNDTPFGLAGKRFDVQPEAPSKVARQVVAGTVGVDSHTIDMAGTFGGMKDSGFGRECGVEGIADYTQLKTLMPPVRHLRLRARGAWASRWQGRLHHGCGPRSGTQSAVKLASEGADVIASDSCTDAKTAACPMATRGPRGDRASGRGAGPAHRRDEGRRRDHHHLKQVVAAGSRNWVAWTSCRPTQASARSRSGTGEPEISRRPSTSTSPACAAPAGHDSAPPGRGRRVDHRRELEAADEKGPRSSLRTSQRRPVSWAWPSRWPTSSRSGTSVDTGAPDGVNTRCSTASAGCPRSSSAARRSARSWSALPVELVEPEDISDAVLWLASDDAKYVTGVELSVDAGSPSAEAVTADGAVGAPGSLAAPPPLVAVRRRVRACPSGRARHVQPSACSAGAPRRGPG